MASSNEQRERKRKVKQFLELNQGLKLVYKQWFILDTGHVVGIPVSDADKKVKMKYIHGYYRTAILDTYPELKNTIISSQSTFEASRDLKHYDEIVIEDNIVRVKSVDEEPKDIGRVANELDIASAKKMMSVASSDVLTVLRDEEIERYDFSDSQVEQLIDYQLIKPCFFDDESYQMYLTISEFPLLKKFKNLRAFTNHYSSDGIWFDVVFETYHGSESYFLKRRFLRM